MCVCGDSSVRRRFCLLFKERFVEEIGGIFVVCGGGEGARFDVGRVIERKGDHLWLKWMCDTKRIDMHHSVIS